MSGKGQQHDPEQNRRNNADADEAGEDSFPASDPPARTPATGPGQPDRHRDDDEDAHRAKGNPSDDRLGGETASAKIQGVKPPQADHR